MSEVRVKINLEEKEDGYGEDAVVVMVEFVLRIMDKLEDRAEDEDAGGIMEGVRGYSDRLVMA